MNFRGARNRIATVNFKQQIIRPLAHAVYNRGIFGGMASYFRVLREMRAYARMSGERLSFSNFSPWPIDRYQQAGDAGMYFYQDTWCAAHLKAAAPSAHVDVGSSMMFLALALQQCPVTYVDVRPMRLNMPGFSFRQGDLVALPFQNGSVVSLSSLSVLEHVGLARYGDALDPRGTDKACAELARVLKPGGRLYVAVPTAAANATHFNAHRVFTPETFIAMFAGLKLTDERYALDDRLICRSQYDELRRPYAFGCFAFAG